MLVFGIDVAQIESMDPQVRAEELERALLALDTLTGVKPGSRNLPSGMWGVLYDDPDDGPLPARLMRLSSVIEIKVCGKTIFNTENLYCADDARGAVAEAMLAVLSRITDLDGHSLDYYAKLADQQANEQTD